MDTSTAWLITAVLAGATAKTRVCNQVFSPFASKRRKSMASVKARLHSRFGDYRNSYVRGHKHAGIDLRGSYRETIFPICRGVVVAIAFGFPHRTVFLKHVLADGKIVYSAYKHVKDPLVAYGDWVEATTPLARLFDRREHRSARFGRAPNHLHLEIRKSLKDNGSASFTAMTRKQLLVYLYDPLEFMRPRMN